MPKVGIPWKQIAPLSFQFKGGTTSGWDVLFLAEIRCENERKKIEKIWKRDKKKERKIEKKVRGNQKAYDA